MRVVLDGLFVSTDLRCMSSYRDQLRETRFRLLCCAFLAGRLSHTRNINLV